MRSLFKLPKIQMAIFLFLIFLSAFWYSPSASKLLTLTLALSSTVISDFMFTKLMGRIPLHADEMDAYKIDKNTEVKIFTIPGNLKYLYQ